jgi:hypothetical protein
LAPVRKRWLNTFTMAGSHASAEPDTTSVASMKLTSQTLLGSVLGKAERPISASPRAKGVHGMRRKYAEANQSKERSNDIHDAIHFLLGAVYAPDCFGSFSFGRENRFVGTAAATGLARASSLAWPAPTCARDAVSGGFIFGGRRRIIARSSHLGTQPPSCRPADKSNSFYPSAAFC